MIFILYISYVLWGDEAKCDTFAAKGEVNSNFH